MQIIPLWYICLGGDFLSINDNDKFKVNRLGIGKRKNYFKNSNEELESNIDFTKTKNREKKNKIEKDKLNLRPIFIFSMIFILFFVLIVRIYILSIGSGLSLASVKHSTYTVTIGRARGTIYDRNMKPLVNQEMQYKAVVYPTKDVSNLLTTLKQFSNEPIENIQKQLSQGHPFVVDMKSQIQDFEGLKNFQIPVRYSGIAPHIIGYMDGGNVSGVAGIEKAYDNLLSNTKAEIDCTFDVDALGRPLPALNIKVNNTILKDEKGVVLTIDKDVQAAVEAAISKLPVGAVVVMGMDGDILGIASSPTFSQDKISDFLKDSNAPLVNRAFSQYNVGSTFKLASAAAALEMGISQSRTYKCTGKILVDGHQINCHLLTGHGVLDMAGALADSCNTYYISLALMVGQDKVLKMADAMSYGKTWELAPNFSPQAGILQSRSEINQPASFANLAIGQGRLLATPLQIACSVTSVASGGLVPTPRLVKAYTDENGKIVKEFPSANPQRIMSQKTANLIQGFMIQTVTTGTGTTAKPKTGGAGGKTASAETGLTKNGKSVVQTWFSGFYPAVNPKYTIVVLAEDGVSGYVSACPIFKDIADRIADLKIQ
jgi:penicillin-binding protein 2